MDAFGDASSYQWDVPQSWTVLSDDGENITVLPSAGPGFVQVVAQNGCGSSFPLTQEVVVNTALVDAGADTVLCLGQSLTLMATTPAADSYLWQPGGGTMATMVVSPEITSTYTITITNGGCTAVDTITVMMDPCLGMADGAAAPVVYLSPVPLRAGQSLRAHNLPATDVLGVVGVDGRRHHVAVQPQGRDALVQTQNLAPGNYLLLGTNGRNLRFVVED
ncbi:MAG: hypothetical protein R2818_15695 [Flavobacteriales bacterium]